MLGYVTAEKAELKMREYEVYSAYYCGLCKSIGERHGQAPRMALSYDFAFLALLLASLQEEKDVIRQEHCLIHHIKKKNIAHDNSYIDYASDMMVLLVHYNLQDDIQDEGSLKARMASLFFHFGFKKLRKSYEAICGTIEKELGVLSKLEAESCANMDQVCDSFAHIMEAIFTGYGRMAEAGAKIGVPEPGEVRDAEHVVEAGEVGETAEAKTKAKTEAPEAVEAPEALEPTDEKTEELETVEFGEATGGKSEVIELTDTEEPAGAVGQQRILGHLGKFIGKWIYLADAWDDLEEDIEKGTYNPFLYRFKFEHEAPGSFRERIRENVEFSMMSSLAEVAKAYELLDIKKNKGIIDNIIYFGLLRRTEQLLKKGKEENE